MPGTDARGLRFLHKLTITAGIHLEQRTAEGGGVPRAFFGFERINFGIVHVRTDGELVLVFTHSSKDGRNDACRFAWPGARAAGGRRTVRFAKHATTR